MEVRFIDRKRAQTPDGGWGYVVVLASSVIMVATSAPTAGFGIIFGDVLEDPTSGITLITSTYNTISFFMGIVANVLLRRSSYRQVALLGSLINFIGGLATVYSPNLHLLILSYGVVQGVGYGLLLPASFSALNAYFDKKMAFMMSINQTLLVVGYMVMPYLSNWCLNFYGYQGSLLLLAGVAAFCFPASLALQPVRWHMKYVEETMDFLPRRQSQTWRRRSSAFVGQRAVSLVSLEHHRKYTGFWQAMLDSMDLDLLGDWKYVNIAIGLSLSFTADIAFFPILPSVMAPQGFTATQIALMISVFFTADLVARIAFSLLAAFVPINSRLVVLLACALSALLRLALPIHDSLQYKLVVLGMMGFMRCFIQTPQALVISDDYPDNFESAYSIYMVVNGVVTLFYGGLMSYIKTVTSSDEWVCHSLTLGFVMVVVTWGVELITTRSKR